MIFFIKDPEIQVRFQHFLQSYDALYGVVICQVLCLVQELLLLGGVLAAKVLNHLLCVLDELFWVFDHNRLMHVPLLEKLQNTHQSSFGLDVQRLFYLAFSRTNELPHSNFLGEIQSNEGLGQQNTDYQSLVLFPKVNRNSRVVLLDDFLH